MEKTFTWGGVSKGYTLKFGVRCANSDATQLMIYKGFTDIDLIPLPRAMTRSEVIEYFLKIDFANGNQEIQAVIETAAKRRGIPLPAKDNPVEEIVDEPEEVVA